MQVTIVYYSIVLKLKSLLIITMTPTDINAYKTITTDINAHV